MVEVITTQDLPITPAVVTWARTRSGFTLEAVERFFPRIVDWELGTAAPTYRQLETMAEKFQVPVAVFFFPEPPDLPPAQHSFRTLPADYFEGIPRTVKAFIRKAQAMQLNLGELTDQRNPAQTLITRDIRFGVNTTAAQLASRVRKYLGISVGEQCKWSTADEAFERWRTALAAVGVFVFKDAFHSETYFGFCLVDDLFPIIYVNNSTAKTRQIFTVFHELAHLLFGTSGVDVADEAYVERLGGKEKQIEITCNRFAGAFLVPDGSFEEALRGKPPNRETAHFLADLFKVSREVIYRKLLDRSAISQAEYNEAVASWARQTTAREGGGNYYYNQIAYLGSSYIDLALSHYSQRRIDAVQLAGYLNIKPRSVEAFEHVYARTR